ncbi:MAG: NAD-dependent epimerase/dehydratase family protein [Actinomycetota bacterium]
MRVLITGGQGFIGRAATTALQAAGHDVTILDLTGPPGSSTVVADIRDASAVRRALTDIDAVIHLAAVVGVEQTIADLPTYTDTNELGTAIVLAQMADAGVRRLVLGSSMVVYGEGIAHCAQHGVVRPAPRRSADLARGRYEPPCPSCGAPLTSALVTEDVSADPRSGYAASKVAQEHLASVWARHTGGTAVALRFHNVYGPGLPQNTLYAGVAAIFRSEVLAGRPPLVTEDGGQRRDFVHVRDIGQACLTGLKAELADGETRAYNVGSGRVRTVLDLASSLARAAGAPAPVITGAARLADVRHITASSERIHAELGWSATEDFDAGMAELLKE